MSKRKKSSKSRSLERQYLLPPGANPANFSNLPPLNGFPSFFNTLVDVMHHETRKQLPKEITCGMPRIVKCKIGSNASCDEIKDVLFNQDRPWEPPVLKTKKKAKKKSSKKKITKPKPKELKHSTHKKSKRKLKQRK